MTTDAERGGLALLICSPTIERPEMFATPLVHALAARALDCAVEIHFAGPAVRVLVDGVADRLFPTPARQKSLRAFLQEAADAGATLLACSMATAAWVAPEERLIPECRGAAGATAYVVRALDPAWRTLVF